MSFKPLEGDTAIMVHNGVWKTCDLYQLDGALFAKWGGGFIRLRSNGTTSKDGVTFRTLHTDRELFKDPHDRLTVESGERRKPFLLENKGLDE